MRALSIRRPWAKLILGGVKTIESRLKRTNKKGERVHIYAALKHIEPREEARIAAEFSIDVDALPRGVLFGPVETAGCVPLAPGHSQVACFEISESAGGIRLAPEESPKDRCLDQTGSAPSTVVLRA